jgi:hypothetical protein
MSKGVPCATLCRGCSTRFPPWGESRKKPTDVFLRYRKSFVDFFRPFDRQTDTLRASKWRFFRWGVYQTPTQTFQGQIWASWTQREAFQTDTPPLTQYRGKLLYTQKRTRPLFPWEFLEFLVTAGYLPKHPRVKQVDRQSRWYTRVDQYTDGLPSPRGRHKNKAKILAQQKVWSEKRKQQNHTTSQ